MKRPQQQTPQELLDSLMDFLCRKFYPGETVAFAKDRPRLLSWVALWPASWLRSRGVTIHPDRYREIFFKVFMDAQAFGSEKIKYRPAWLRMVIQSYFAHHGEAIYEEAKSLRAMVEQTMQMATRNGASSVADPIAELAAARRLVSPRKRPAPAPKKDQLTLL